VIHLNVMHFLFAAASSNPFHYVIDFFRGILRTFHGFTGSWGISIILLTVCVRIVLFPLTWKQFRSAQHMQLLQPKIKELQTKFKGDKQRLQQETMKLYQEHRVNPFASCLPLLLQLPVFFCLYYAIRGTVELREAHFLWLTLGKPDPYFILLLFYVISQLASTELSLQYTSDNRQKWMMRAMPLFFVVILLRFPSGLFVYWVTTNVWTVGQQLIIRKTMKALPAAAPAKPRKQSRFMQAMAQAQEQRAAQGGKPGPGGRPVKKGGRPGQGGGRPGQGGGRPGGKPAGKLGVRPAGKQAVRPAGKPGVRPAGASGSQSGGPGGQGDRPGGQGGRPPGQGDGQGGRPGGQGSGTGRPSGQPATRSQGSQAGKPGARPSGKPGGRPQGGPGGGQGGRPGGQRPKPGGASGGKS
jgi:YidC/Oxa1 family membrane protein insertase